jgi:SAM-dependent methyltransferase
VRPVFDDRYGCKDIFALARCTACDHLMTDPPLAEEELGLLYSTYYPRKHVETAGLVAAASGVAGSLARIKRWWNGTNNQGQYSVTPSQVMLDVGCGSGLSLLEAAALGAQAYGIEADPNVRRIADELGLKIHIGSLYDHPFPGIFFDLIVLNQVIEHFPDPGKALDSLKERLKPTGRLVLVLPNRSSLWQKLSGEKWINWHVPYHLHHFDVNGLLAFARRHGYTVTYQSTITPNIWTILQLRAWRHSTSSGTPSQIWEVRSAAKNASSDTSLPAGLSLGRVFRKLAKLAALFGLAVINRIVDLFGLGDSVLVELKIDRSS